MNRSAKAWLIFAAALVVALAAMVWLSITLLKFDRMNTEDQRLADRQQAVRIALWKMDSALAPLIAQENARPFGAFASTGAFPPRPPEIRLYFQWDTRGQPVSPEIGMEAELKKLGEIAPVTTLARSAPVLTTSIALNLNNSPITNGNISIFNNGTANARSIESIGNSRVSQNRIVGEQAQQDFTQRANNSAQLASSANIGLNGGGFPTPIPPPPSNEWTGGAVAPWTDGRELLLIRSARFGSNDYVQGCWLDWPVLSAGLLDQIRDDFPSAALRLVSTTELAKAPPETRLASLPILFIPGSYALEMPGDSWPVRGVLAVAWGGVLCAVAAVALLLRGAMALSERRAAFVSAVTHEMRTPLTTFRLYTDLLRENRVASEADRVDYLRLLGDEAERLSHMVENVLSQSRLERGMNHKPAEAVEVAALIDRVSDRLRRRAQRSGMELVIESNEQAMRSRVRVELVSLEQILSNLIDNACKYANGSADRRIHWRIARVDGAIQLHIQDHGPGIDPAQSRRLFEPFGKSAHQAADSAPGIGLGLALSRRLARAMKGDLQLASSSPSGAVFILSLQLES